MGLQVMIGEGIVEAFWDAGMYYVMVRARYLVSADFRR